MTAPRDHGGALDAAIATHGGQRADWLDLSTGINPVPYPVGSISHDAWTSLPDRNAERHLIDAARKFWNVPDSATILPVNGASAAIARLPSLLPPDRVRIDSPTYNEHAAAFETAGWVIEAHATSARVIVHPNNPTGTLWDGTADNDQLIIVDESFCDVAPQSSYIGRADRPNFLILKSFGKFWGLAGLRLGFVIGDPKLVDRLRATLGPWSVSGPALEIATRALQDTDWAQSARQRLQQDAHQLDDLMTAHNAQIVGGTTLFRLYHVNDAFELHKSLAQNHILTRIFPYSRTWIRFGLPAPDQWTRLETAL